MLDEGVIQESGSYEELRNKNGMFVTFIKNCQTNEPDEANGIFTQNILKLKN
jgi:hypothetical protein